MAKKILVVDDDPVGGALLEARLMKQGFWVTRAMNGIQGLDTARVFKPSLIILDIEMPEMNGYTFVGELKKIEDISNTPVIVLTSHEENKSIFARKGIKYYLVKPVNFDVLFSTINEILPGN